jgi:hypothetical protein
MLVLVGPGWAIGSAPAIVEVAGGILKTLALSRGASN